MTPQQTARLEQAAAHYDCAVREVAARMAAELPKWQHMNRRLAAQIEKLEGGHHA